MLRIVSLRTGEDMELTTVRDNTPLPETVKCQICGRRFAHAQEVETIMDGTGFVWIFCSGCGLLVSSSAYVAVRELGVVHQC